MPCCDFPQRGHLTGERRGGGRGRTHMACGIPPPSTNPLPKSTTSPTKCRVGRRARGRGVVPQLLQPSRHCVVASGQRACTRISSSMSSTSSTLASVRVAGYFRSQANRGCRAIRNAASWNARSVGRAWERMYTTTETFEQQNNPPAL